MAHSPTMLQHGFFVELQECIQLFHPISHVHHLAFFRLTLRIIQIYRNNAVQIIHFRFIEIVLCNRNIRFAYHSVGCILPSSQSHIRLIGIHTGNNNLSCRLPGNCPMQLILNSCKKLLGYIATHFIVGTTL